MPPLLPTQQVFSLPNPPVDPIVNITEFDRKAVDLIALKHPSTESPAFVNPLTFAALSMHHVKAILQTNGLCEQYFVPLFYGHLTAAWTLEDEFKISSFQEGEMLEKQYQVQMCSLLRRFPPTLDEVRHLGKFIAKEIDDLSATKSDRQKEEYHKNNRHRFPIELLNPKVNSNKEILLKNCIQDRQQLLPYELNVLSLTQEYVENIWSSMKIEEIIAYYGVYAAANAQLMKSYLVGSFITMIFATASENMSANWYEKRFNALCSLFPDLFIKVVVSTDIIERYTKLYLRQEIPQETIYTAFLYSCDLTKDFITENKISWIISQIHTNSVRAALGLGELALSNRFLTHSFLSQHIPDDQFKAIGILVMEIFRDPFISIVVSNRKALRYLYPDLAYLGISASSHFSLYPCKPLGTAVNTKEGLDGLLGAIKEIAMEIEGARLFSDDTPQIGLEPEEVRRRSMMNPYEQWEQYITKNMTPKDYAFATLMNKLLQTCRTGIIELIRNAGWNGSRKQIITEDLSSKLELFGIVVPESYKHAETPLFPWKLNLDEPRRLKCLDDDCF